MTIKLKKSMILFVVLYFLMASLHSETVATPPSNFFDADAGSVQNPFMIANLANLRWLSETQDMWGSDNQKTHFKQTADIDAAETIDWNDGVGFNPIGIYQVLLNPYKEIEIPFMGIYDGNNFKTVNLNINYSAPPIQHIGLFGFTKGSIIKNVHLVQADIKSTVVAGVLVGFASGGDLIFNCTASGTLYADNGAVSGLVQGLTNSTLLASSSSVDISTRGAFAVGGLVMQAASSVIKDSYFNGTIKNIAPNNGGLGLQYGGIIGQAISGSNIENVYANSLENFDDFTFGVVGRLIDSSTVKLSFWDTEKTGVSRAVGENEGTIVEVYGLATDGMKNKNNYTRAGWDFENVWDINPEINNGYPYLREGIILNSGDIILPAPNFSMYNYPNPFNPTTTIKFKIENLELGVNHHPVRIDIFNIKGQKIRSLVDRFYSIGEHSVVWNGNDDYGVGVSSGVYFYRFETGSHSESKKMLMVK